MDAQALLAYVDQHREWTGVVVFLLALAETIPLLSALIVSTPFIMGMGTLVAAGAMDFPPIFLGVSLGAFSGSTFAWWLGHRFGGAILAWKPIARRPDWIAAARRFMARWGIWAVTLAHIFPAVTSAMFLVAGVTRVPFWRFQMANVPGILLYAFLIPKSGEWGGDLAQHLWTVLSAP